MGISGEGIQREFMGGNSTGGEFNESPPPGREIIAAVSASATSTLWRRTTSHPRGGKSSFSIALICTTSRRIAESASTNQGPEKGDLITLGGLVSELCGEDIGVSCKLAEEAREATSQTKKVFSFFSQ